MLKTSLGALPFIIGHLEPNQDTALHSPHLNIACYFLASTKNYD